MQQDDPDDLVETIFRNGTLTVVGIVLAFSLGFVTHWAANPIPWQPQDAFALFPILIGIGLQIRALSDLLKHDCLKKRSFKRANRYFMTGLILTSGGVALAILFDFFEISKIATLVG
ncbi:MAG: hypothetical protein WBA88_07675 [Pseudaminobacter sp.]